MKSDSAIISEEANDYGYGSIDHGSDFPEFSSLHYSFLQLSSLNVQTTRKSINALEWLKMPQFYLTAGIYVASRVCVTILQAYIAFFIEYTTTLPSNYIAVVPLVMYISGFLGSLFLRFVTNRFDPKIAFILAGIVGMSKFYVIIF